MTGKLPIQARKLVWLMLQAIAQDATTTARKMKRLKGSAAADI